MAHLYTYSCMDMILILKIYIKPFFSDQCCRFLCQCIFFLANINSKTVTFLQVEIVLELISLTFPSCRLPQANLLQYFIRFSISKRQGQKPKLSLILFHLYGMIITFWGLMEKNGNAYGVIQVSK